MVRSTALLFVGYEYLIVKRLCADLCSGYPIGDQVFTPGKQPRLANSIMLIFVLAC